MSVILLHNRCKIFLAKHFVQHRTSDTTRAPRSKTRTKYDQFEKHRREDHSNTCGCENTLRSVWKRTFFQNILHST